MQGVHVKKNGLIRNVKKYRLYYLLALPGLLYLLVFHYGPMVGILMAFRDFKPMQGFMGIFTGKWVGLKYFEQFFHSAYAGRVIGNTVWIFFLRLIWGFPAPILLALLLNEVHCLPFKKTVQTISYFPHFVSYVVVLAIARWLFNADGGLINAIRTANGLNAIPFLSDSRYFRAILVGTGVWKGIGWASIIFLAAMTGIDPQLYEAAEMDGANRLQRVWHITLPGIAPVIAIQLILRMGSIMDAGFDQTLLFYSSAVYDVGDIIDTYVYRMGIGSMKYGFATAVGLFKSVVGLLFVLGSNYAARLIGQEGIW